MAEEEAAPTSVVGEEEEEEVNDDEGVGIIAGTAYTGCTTALLDVDRLLTASEQSLLLIA